MSDKKLQVIPLGGLGEFGMNSMAIRYGDDIIVLDAGMMFPDAELLGVDIVTPDFSYLRDNKEKVRGLLLTHAHEDHIGGVPFLLSEVATPVYGTAFTLAMVERRLEEHSMLDKVNLNEIQPGDRIKLGPFEVEFIHVTHSTASCVALAITTPLGVIIHTGDFKVDPTPLDGRPFDLHKFAEYGKKRRPAPPFGLDQRRPLRLFGKRTLRRPAPGRDHGPQRTARRRQLLQLLRPPPADDLRRGPEIGPQGRPPRP